MNILSGIFPEMAEQKVAIPENDNNDSDGEQKHGASASRKQDPHPPPLSYQDLIPTIYQHTNLF